MGILLVIPPPWHSSLGGIGGFQSTGSIPLGDSFFGCGCPWPSRATGETADEIVVAVEFRLQSIIIAAEWTRQRL